MQSISSIAYLKLMFWFGLTLGLVVGVLSTLMLFASGIVTITK